MSEHPDDVMDSSARAKPAALIGGITKAMVTESWSRSRALTVAGLMHVLSGALWAYATLAMALWAADRGGAWLAMYLPFLLLLFGFTALHIFIGRGCILGRGRARVWSIVVASLAVLSGLASLAEPVGLVTLVWFGLVFGLSIAGDVTSDATSESLQTAGELNENNPELVYDPDTGSWRERSRHSN